MKNIKLDDVVDEWENIAKGTKTVPLVTLNTDSIKTERKVFSYCAKILKDYIKNVKSGS